MFKLTIMTNDQSFLRRWHVKPNARRMLNSYESLEHLLEYIKQGSTEVITMCMNKHLLQGGSLSELVKLVQQDNYRLGSNDFLTEQRIKGHIGWCCQPQRGLIIQKNKFNVYRIVGYRGERDPHIDAEHAIQESYYSFSTPIGNYDSHNKGDNNFFESEKEQVRFKEKIISDNSNRSKMINTDLGKGKMKIEKSLIELISHFLDKNANWLSNAFMMTELISNSRESRYGFEWPVQTALGSFLLGLQDESKVSSVRVGMQEKNKKKYDISFEMFGEKIIIEIKTPTGGAISYAKSDVQKEFPERSLPFFLIFSDPKAPLNAPFLEGTRTLKTWKTHEDFMCYLYIKKI